MSRIHETTAIAEISRRFNQCLIDKNEFPQDIAAEFGISINTLLKLLYDKPYVINRSQL